MRILLLDTHYPAFLAAHYEADPSLAERPYEVQWRSLMQTFFGTADSYSHHLRLLGHEATEIVVNCDPLQDAWRREHLRGLNGRLRRPVRAPWRTRVMFAQVDAFAPDVIYVQDVRAFDPMATRMLAARAKLLVGQTAVRLPASETLHSYDLVVSSLRNLVEDVRRGGLNAELLRLAFDRRLLAALGEVPLQHDIVFAGQLGASQHSSRNRLLEHAARRLPLELYGFGIEEQAEDSPLRHAYRGQSWGLPMFRLLAGSRICLNRHSENAGTHANNMRLYEATGVGSLLLTDAKDDLGEIFDPGREIATYHDADELVSVARRLLANEEERAAIARAGQQRTLRDHTYEVRMAELIEILCRYLP